MPANTLYLHICGVLIFCSRLLEGVTYVLLFRRSIADVVAVTQCERNFKEKR